MPTPQEGETENEFVNRCVSNEKTIEEFPDQEQRVAVCFSQFRKKDMAGDFPLKTSVDDGHFHFFEIGMEGNGRTVNTINVEGGNSPPHVHQITEGNVLEANDHIHTLPEEYKSPGEEKESEFPERELSEGYSLIKNQVLKMIPFHDIYIEPFIRDGFILENKELTKLSICNIEVGVFQIKLNKKIDGLKLFKDDPCDVLLKYNSENAFSYLDVPDNYSEKELQFLSDSLRQFNGKFILTMKDSKNSRKILSNFRINKFGGTGVLLVSNYVSEVRKENSRIVSEGLSLLSPHARMIWEGSKRTIIKNFIDENLLGKNLYLINGNLCYGIVRLKEPKKIGLEEFEDLADAHRLTTDERIERWGDNEELYSYQVEVLDLFESPKRVESSNGLAHIKDVKFLAVTTSPDSAGSSISSKGLQPVKFAKKKKKKTKYQSTEPGAVYYNIKEIMGGLENDKGMRN